MCGIYGVFAPGAPMPDGLLAGMDVALHHRGPDAGHLVGSSQAELGCRRLRIIDLSRAADQPFEHPDGSLAVSCNGEIYNARELRSRYSDYPYRSSSDVEVILPLYEQLGASGLAELDGMFALAIDDRRRGALVLARDRAGEKPLFFVRRGAELWFASEMQALLELPGISRELDEVALRQYLALGYVLSPRTIFRDIRQAPAGSVLEITASSELATPYWRPGVGEPDSEPHTPERLLQLLREAVRKQMIADVPVAIYLSGGLDSALLATLASELAGSPLNTFVARFSEDSYDESRWARQIAGSIGAHHSEVVIDEQSMAEAFDAITSGIADPIADPALLPTYLLAREAGDSVRVVLSGEGADELFGGYPTYLGHLYAVRYGRLPGPLRKTLESAVRHLPASRRKVTIEFLLKRFIGGARESAPRRHLRWFGVGADELSSLEAWAAEERLSEMWRGADDVSAAMVFDYATYLRDNLLVKLDRATMLSSVEPRAPYLDRDVTAFAWSLPKSRLVRGLTTKVLLKQAALEVLPKSFVHRRKRGLSVPIASWIDGGLRAETDRLLEPERLRRQEIFDPEAVQRALAEHRSGRANRARRLWPVIYLQRWLERWCPERAIPG